jgi:hypothetical protein
MFIQLVGVNSIVVSLLFTVIYNEIDPPLLINNFSTISNVSSLQIISGAIHDNTALLTSGFGSDWIRYKYAEKTSVRSKKRRPSDEDLPYCRD